MGCGDGDRAEGSDEGTPRWDLTTTWVPKATIPDGCPGDPQGEHGITHAAPPAVLRRNEWKG